MRPPPCAMPGDIKVGESIAAYFARKAPSRLTAPQLRRLGLSSDANAQLTAWLAGDVNPGAAGVYLRRPGALLWSRWDGLAWMRGSTDRIEARNATARSAYQTVPWRGLTEDAYRVLLVRVLKKTRPYRGPLA